jgi:nucleoside phosphorylase/CheY-like chemotaxis protein
MFNILIVEDDTEKLRNILLTLGKISGINVDQIHHEIDSFNAKKRIKEISYDLLILDISIPLRKSEKIDPEGGIKLRQEITGRDIYKLPIHIIGLTAHEDIFLKAVNEFSSQILSVIRYSDSDIEWQHKLCSGVEQRMHSKASASQEEQAYNYDIAIITALDIEFQAVKNLSTTWKRLVVPQDSSLYYETEFIGNNKTFRVVAACAPHMGMNSCSVLSMKMIFNFRPKYLFMTGIAASIKDENSHGYGDILVIDESWDGGAGKITQTENGKNQFLAVANNIRLDQDVSDKMRALKNNSKLLRKIKDDWKTGAVPNTELTIHIGSVASVAGVIENSAVIDELKIKDRKLLGLEMETYGMYYSAHNCSNPKPISIGLKSVCDFANTNKNDIYQNYASYTSAQVMYELIISEL